jgi:large subunit ribosomal protein L15
MFFPLRPDLTPDSTPDIKNSIKDEEAISTSKPTMPPRLPVLSGRLFQLSNPSYSPLCFLLPQLQPQSRNAHILGSLSDNPGAYNKRIRKGRGPASGKGKTSGRGHKGQKQHGKVPAGFNGGQTPDLIVHGNRGIENAYV